MRLRGLLWLLLASGCGDTGLPPGAPDDFAVPPDIPAVVDLACGPNTPPGNGCFWEPPQHDLALVLASAHVALTDVAGTFYQPNGAGGEQPAPFTHLLIAQQTLAMFPAYDQYIDPDFSGTPGQLHGCTASHYDLATGPLPNPDVDAGLVTYKGYATSLFAGDARMTAVYSPPIPDTIQCSFPGAVNPFYACTFGAAGSGMSNTIDGEATSAVFFPAIDSALFASPCPAFTTPHTGPFGAGGATITLCEQHPIATGTTITESVAGGNGYGALLNESVPLAGTLGAPMTVVQINGVNLTAAQQADPLSAAPKLDGSADVTIAWSCDGTGTPGSGCPTGAAGLLDVAALQAIAVTTPRSAFALTQRYGTARCIEMLGSGTVTLKKAAILQMLQGQTGGSIQLTLARLSLDPAATMGHVVFFSAGQGWFSQQQQ